MTIGSFSMLTGLSIATLRHYDEIGLLRPSEVDAQTSYRRYTSGQVVIGRRIRLLRSADLSIQQIARILDGDEQDAREVLGQHRSALDQRSSRISALLDELLQTDNPGRFVPMKSAADFRLVAINIGVDSKAALDTACGFWGVVLGTDLEDWGSGSQQVVLGEGDSIGFLNIRVRSADEPHYGDITAFGLGVLGLDDVHQRAITAGATEQYAPTDGENMPRHSLIVDPVGNRVVLWESEK